MERDRERLAVGLVLARLYAGAALRTWQGVAVVEAPSLAARAVLAAAGWQPVDSRDWRRALAFEVPPSLAMPVVADVGLDDAAPAVAA